VGIDAPNLPEAAFRPDFLANPLSIEWYKMLKLSILPILLFLSLVSVGYGQDEREDFKATQATSLGDATVVRSSETTLTVEYLDPETGGMLGKFTLSRAPGSLTEEISLGEDCEKFTINRGVHRRSPHGGRRHRIAQQKVGERILVRLGSCRSRQRLPKGNHDQDGDQIEMKECGPPSNRRAALGGCIRWGIEKVEVEYKIGANPDGTPTAGGSSLVAFEKGSRGVQRRESGTR
jgi:hypothetical protein